MSTTLGRLTDLAPQPSARAAQLAVLSALVIALSPVAGFTGLGVLAVAGVWDFARARRQGLPTLTVDAPGRLAQGAHAELELTVADREPRARFRLALELSAELAEPETLEVLELATDGRGRARARLPIAGLRRGRHAVAACDVQRLGPFGLASWEGRVELEREVLVVPGLREAVRERARAVHADRRAGQRRARRVEGAGSFESLREYVRGDDPRRLDWKASARHRKPIVRRYESERSQNVVLCLDTGRAMAERVVSGDAAHELETPAWIGARSRLDHAAEAACVLSQVAHGFEDHVGLFAFADDVQVDLAPHALGWRKVPEQLATIAARAVEPDYPQAFVRLERLLPRRSLIVLFSDLVDPRASAPFARALRPLARRHLVVLCALRNPELDLLTTRELTTERDALRRAAAHELLLERERALAGLRERGVTVLDVPPGGAIESSVARYAEIKRRGAL